MRRTSSTTLLKSTEANVRFCRFTLTAPVCVVCGVPFRYCIRILLGVLHQAKWPPIWIPPKGLGANVS
eukprot:7138695-Pyramimonas_sp.AAC.1